MLEGEEYDACGNERFAGGKAESVYHQAEAKVQRKMLSRQQEPPRAHILLGAAPPQLEPPVGPSRIFMWKFIPDVQAQARFLYDALRVLTKDKPHSASRVRGNITLPIQSTGPTLSLA